jgi:hypothetical protein
MVTTVSHQERYVEPTLGECGGALTRMGVVLLLELIIELILVLFSCILASDRALCKRVAPWRTTLLIAYSIPVVLVNTSILWLGSAPTGSCITYHGEVRLIFATLILYMIWKLAQVVAAIIGSGHRGRGGGGGRKSGRDMECGVSRTAGADSRGWGKGEARGGGGGGVVLNDPDEGFTYLSETEDAPNREFTCCGLIRVQS